MSVLMWYIIISYVAGAGLFAIESYRALKHGEFPMLGFGLILLALSPLTAWHGVLHYVAVLWHRFNGTPFKPFI